MGDFRIISSNVVSEVTTVRLYDETVEKVKARHPEVPAELPCIQGAVNQAIQAPTHVEESHSNTFVFVDSNTTNHGGDPLRVPVRIVGGTEGRVASFYFASTSYEPKVIWRREDG